MINKIDPRPCLALLLVIAACGDEPPRARSTPCDADAGTGDAAWSFDSGVNSTCDDRWGTYHSMCSTIGNDRLHADCIQFAQSEWTTCLSRIGCDARAGWLECKLGCEERYYRCLHEQRTDCVLDSCVDACPTEPACPA